MFYVSIDTNILLTFYSFNKEQLDKLKSIVELIKGGKIQLILTEQVTNEFEKNREKQLKETIQYVKGFTQTVKGSLTHHDFDEIKEIDTKRQEIKELSNTLLEKIEPMIVNETLPADKIIQEIFSIAKNLPVTDTLFNKAKIRHQKGIPPGKIHSYGDAIIWELLLETVPKGEDLYFICADKDFSSLLDENRIHPFLKKEWEKIKSSNIHYYFGSISKFLKDKFPDLEITDKAIEIEVQTSGRVIALNEFYGSSASDSHIGYPSSGSNDVKMNAESPAISEGTYVNPLFGRIPVDVYRGPVAVVEKTNKR